MSGSGVAWLIFGTHKPPRRARDRGWLNYQPLGVKVLAEVLDAAGVDAGTCSAASAAERQVVLVSLSSEHDVHAFLAAVAAREDWQPGRRRFRVVAGGFGMQNPQPLRHFVDYAYFGRAEEDIVALVAAAERGEPADSDAVMHLPEVSPVTVAQPVTLFDGMFREEFVGCPLRCKFCHYTFARRHLGGDHAYSRTETVAGDYVQTMGHGGKRNPTNSIEATWPQLLDWPHPPGATNISAAIDGPSERLRWLYGKRITRAEVVEGIENIIKTVRGHGLNGVYLTHYDIRFPAETDADRAELLDTLAEISPDTGPHFRAYVNFAITPFKPSPWTPMQWEPFEMRDCRPWGGRRLHTWSDNAYAIVKNYVESPRTQVEHAAVIRHDGSAEADRALAATRTPEWKRMAAIAAARSWRAAFPEFADFALGAHEVGAPLPTQAARGVADLATLERIAARTRDDEAASRDDPTYRRGKRSIMGRTLIPVAPA